MPDNNNELPEVDAPVSTWLLPLDGEPTGVDLEYDPDYLELNTAAAGKPETQFAAAEPPAWGAVKERAEALFERTRDLRLAVIWARACVNREGLGALLPALQLLHGLVDDYWDLGLHPALDPDDGDAFARFSALGSLDKVDGLLGDVRQALLMPDRRLGGLRVRDVEIALDRLAPRADELPRSRSEIQGLLAEFPDLAERLQRSTQGSLQVLQRLERAMNERFGVADSVDVKALRGMLDTVLQVLPSAEPAGADAADDADDADAAFDLDDPAPADAQAEAESDAGGDARRTRSPGRGAGARSGGGIDRIDSRKDVIRAINAVCQYLERHEPTNPAQLLLRRAERLIEKNFLELVRELAPDAVNEVARVMGVDPETIGEPS